MIVPSLCLAGSALLALSCVEAQEPDFVELYRADEPRSRAEGAFAVSTEPERLVVLARAAPVAALRLAADAAVTPLEIGPTLPASLEPLESWALSPRWDRLAVVAVGRNEPARSTSITIGGDVVATFPGVQQVRLLGAPGRVLLERVVDPRSRPHRVRVVDLARGVQLDVEVADARRIRASADGETLVVEGPNGLQVHRPERAVLDLPPCASFHLFADGERIACANDDGVDLVTLGKADGVLSRRRLSASPRLLAAADAGDRLLLVSGEVAELHDLSVASGDVSWRLPAPRGARFVSCDLRTTSQGPVAAVGARRKVVPQLEPAGLAHPARAEALVRVLDAQGDPLVEHDFVATAWEGDQPRVLFAGDGRLLVVTRGQVRASRTLFR